MVKDIIQRRLAAVLAADVVGYSRLMGQDEAGTFAALKTRRKDVLEPVVSRHRGRIFKIMGDGVFVEFGSAVNAVQCAVELQQGMAAANSGLPEDRRIVLRIGVNLGDVMIEGSDLYGDGVNIAARLEALAEPAGICISAKVHDEVRNRLNLSFDDLGERQFKNIATAVRAYRVGRETHSDRLRPQPPTLPDRASIAVLPFANMSSDPEQEFFAHGLAEDLITDLSKVPGLLVIARNSSFAYQGRSVDIQSIARDLGVRYVIEGSVRRAVTRVRINAQLIDASTGNHIWADRFDRDLADIFVVQDEVVSKIVSALSGVLPTAQPPQKQRRPTNLEAYDLFVRGRSLTLQSLQATQEARSFLEKAIELDPDVAEAHAWLAIGHHFGFMYCGEPPEEHRMLARSSAQQAVLLDPDNADAHITLGYLRAYDGELAEGVAECELGLRINPSHADGWTLLADLRVFEGRAAEGINCVSNSFRLNPYPRGNYFWALGWAQYAAGKYQEAVETLRHTSATGPGVRRILAGALAQLGRMSEAQEEARKFLMEFPNFSARQWGSAHPFRNDADRQHFIDGYLKAGLPE
jgi:TolB-like protein